jgi:lipopolysaccharide transport system permease protein
MVSKVYFPRLAIPTAAVLSGLPDLGLALVVLGVLMGVEGVAPAATAPLLVVVVLAAVLAGLGVTAWTSAVNVAYRDVRYAIPFVVQLWLFATPSIYSATRLHGVAAVLADLNPMTGVIAGFRWALFGTSPASSTTIVVPVLVAGGLLVTGLMYFRRVERFFADVI